MISQRHNDELRRMYDLRRTANVHIKKRRLEEIYRAIPEYKALDDTMPDIAMEKAQAILHGEDISHNSRLSLGAIDEKKRRLLTDNGYPPDYLDPIYTCPDCRDTGYIGSARCHCYKEAFMDMLCREYKINKVSFSDFNINYYPDDYIDETNENINEETVDEAYEKEIEAEKLVEFEFNGQSSKDFGVIVTTIENNNINQQNQSSKIYVTTDNKPKKKKFNLNLTKEFKIALLIIVILFVFVLILDLLPSLF